MNLLVKAMPTDPNHSDFGWYALVVFEDNKQLQSIAKYRKKLLELANDTDDFSDLQEFHFYVGNVIFLKSDATYVEHVPEGPGLASESVADFFENSKEEGSDPSFLWVPSSKRFEENEGMCSTVNDTMVVDKIGVRWISEEEYGDETSTSATVSYEELFKGKL